MTPGPLTAWIRRHRAAAAGLAVAIAAGVWLRSARCRGAARGVAWHLDGRSRRGGRVLYEALSGDGLRTGG